MSKSLREMQTEVHVVNVEKGWFREQRTFGDGIALLHTELSEALEAFRSWGLADKTHDLGAHLSGCAYSPSNAVAGVACTCPIETQKPEGVGSEYADVLIRLLDACTRDGINLEAEYERKLAYNRTRPYRHGGRSL